MSLYHNKVIEFMKWKDKKILDLCGFKGYFTKKDEELLLTKISNVLIKKVWDSMVKGVIVGHSRGTLHASVHCPYCVLNSIGYLTKCTQCLYKQEHFVCTYDSSTYKKLIRHIKANTEFCSVTILLGTNEIYDKIISINKGGV